MEDWNEALEDLRREYLREVPERVIALRTCVERLRVVPDDAELLNELRSGFHLFAGSGATYGFPRVTELGREGEQLCLAAKKRGVALPESLKIWETLLADVDDAISNALRSVAQAPDSAAPSPSAEEGPLDALVVDDDPAIVRLVAQLLGHEGYLVREAVTLSEAHLALDQRVPDVLVTDVLLPDGKGFELVEALRRTPGGDATVVLVVSVRAGFLDRVEAITCGADAYFEKPVDWEALLRKLRQIVDARRVVASRVLSVEDDPHQAAFIRRVLESGGYEVRVCADPRHFETDLATFQPDLVLMDVLLPGVSGYDLVRYVRQEDKHATTPVVMLTAENRVDARISAARSGADDFLLKPIVPGLLLSTVTARVERARLLRGLLERDGLTGLLTHTAFLGRSRAVAARAARTGSSRTVAWAMIDIDKFKAVNDRHGHPTGDRVLAALALHLQRRLRPSDTIGRYGGEEFAVLVEDVDAGDAVRLFDRLRSEFGRQPHRTPSGEEILVTFSVGLAMWTGAADSVEAWRQRADDALYAAKREGRNRVVLASEDLVPSA